MNDIAVASGKGRRTVYTYFTCKEDVYLAVIQTELERLYARLEEVASLDISPDEKIAKLIFTHLHIIKEAVYRNGTLRAEFFRDVWKVESVRKKFDKNEITIFRRVMHEGVDKGVFEIRNVRLMAQIVHSCIRGCEVPFIYGRDAFENPEELTPYVHSMVSKLFGNPNAHKQ